MLASIFLIIFAINSFVNTKLPLGNGFDQSVAFKYLPPEEKKELKKYMLHLFGLDHRPKPHKSYVPHYLQELYKSYLNEESTYLIEDGNPVIIEGENLTKSSLSAINHSDIIVTFINQNSDTLYSKNKYFWFYVRQVVYDENVVAAEFRLFRNSSVFRLNPPELFNLRIYAVLDPLKKNLQLIDHRKISHEHGWIMFNVTQAMIDWVNQPDRNYGLFLKVTNLSEKELNLSDVGLIGSKSGSDKQPFLVTFFKNSLNSRRFKRASKRKPEVTTYDVYSEKYSFSHETKYSSRDSCRKRELYVDFKELGWQDWIIAPDGYSAFFCDGECSFPLNAHMNATNHAIVQTLVHLMNPSTIPKPCCAPTKLSSIMVLFFDDNSNVILKKYKNMVVKSCGCH